MNKTHLIIITRGFPVNEEELSFLLPELRVIDNDFDIILIPKYTTSSPKLLCDDYPYIKCDCRLSISQLIKYGFLSLLDSRLYKEWKELKKKHILTFAIMKQTATDILYSKQLDTILKKVINTISKNDYIVIYSYWYDYSLLSATKIKDNRQLKIITRLHGFDIYHERSMTGYQCFKEQLEDKIDRLVFISNYGKKYYKQNFSHGDNINEKLQVHYLGTRKGKYHSLKENNKLVLLSCSYIVALKRIDILIEALAAVENLEVEWVHIGDGENRDQIISMAHQFLDSKKNISYKFLGHMEIEDIYRYYDTHYIDCFVLLSDTEGIPVSIMEAMSFGIPTIANDVGGVKEIVNTANGWLLPPKVSFSDVLNVLYQYKKLTLQEKDDKRKNAYETWNRNFNIDRNATLFGKMIKDMVK